ncbi:unnamed protein product [Rotaria sp. Silwood2]|nr:unnamed protein product [Rotaria sp. Silwood2]
MNKLSKSVEVLKLLSTTTSETLSIKGNNEDDYNVPLTVEENLNQLVKVLHLLPVREHGDPHLRGACANLLAKLIQTTVHL